MNTRRHLMLAAGATALAAQLPATASAQTFPSRPLRFIMPYPPGGSSEILARPIAQEMTKFFGQPVIVDFKPGAGSTIGADTVAKSAPDGHTVVMMLSAHAINATLMPKLPYDTVKDFAPVTLVATTPLVLVANPGVPVNNVKELIAYAKANPGKLNFGSGGTGTSNHLAGEMFKAYTGTDMQHVPYKGTPAAHADLLGGQIGLLFDNIVAVMGHVKSGKVKALAVTSANRAASLPDVPTVAESGVPGFEAVSWIGALVPTGTPKDIVDKIHTDMVAVLKMPDVREKLGASGAVLVGNTQAEFAAWNRNEIEKWAKAVKASGAKGD